MNRKELVEKVVSNCSVGQKDAKSIVDFVLSQLLEAGTSGDGFTSPILMIKPRERKEKVVSTANGDVRVPAKKFIHIVPTKVGNTQ